MGKSLKTLIELMGVIIIVMIVAIVGGKYFSEPITTAARSISNFVVEKKRDVLRLSYKCPQNLKTINIPEGKVCRDDVVNSVYKEIFDSYPAKGKGKQQIYDFLSNGNVESADLILRNQIPVDRYETLTLAGDISWTEDPYKSRYWRYLFFGFRPFNNLFAAFDNTYKQQYLQKYKSVALSFISKGVDKTHAWDDFHAVSFRAMAFVKLWWELRENNLLDYETNQTLLKSIEQHALFLQDPNHYEPGHNHGVNEAAALYLIGVNFPELDGAEHWSELGRERLNEGLLSLVGEDGVIVENSPYYHFYTIEKYWELYKYSKTWNAPISDTFEERLNKMIEYASYVLNPNNEIPLLGASLKRRIFYSGMYEQMAQQSSILKFVLTQGKQGAQPAHRIKTFTESGQTIMRSGWSTEKEFSKESQVFFDAGPYRTSHSDLDALSFTLYGNGMELLPDAGLYTYTESKERNYFKGTSAHNTVVVDNQDQSKGSAELGDAIEGSGFVSQAAVHNLYDGVQHKRSLTLIGKRYLLVVDKLSSTKDHMYQQLFHLFPNSNLETDGNASRIIDSKGKQVMRIIQLDSNTPSLKVITCQRDPIQGFCAYEYEKMFECPTLSYQLQGKDISYVTLFEIGEEDKNFEYSFDGKSLVLSDSSDNITVTISESQHLEPEVVVEKPSTTTSVVENFSALSGWGLSNLNSLNFKENAIIFNSRRDGKAGSIKHSFIKDLSEKDLRVELSVTNRKALKSLRLNLYSNNQTSTASIDLRNSYRIEYEGERLFLTVGKGDVRSYGGQWEFTGKQFNWADVESIEFSVAAITGQESTITVHSISLQNVVKNGSVIFVFDDGYESILPAIDVMSRFNMKGNIAVISDRVKNNTRGYLSLRKLQEISKLGWNIVNHSEHHYNAVDEYYTKAKLDDFEADLVNGSRFLTENSLNTAPNWYIYPHGATNGALKDIVRKYYLFARTTINQPESYPFGDPYGVKTISADSVESGNQAKFTPLADLISAVSDAKKYNNPLFITFHRIHSLPTDRDGYNLKDFEELVSYISRENVPVKTLQQLDSDNGIGQTKFEYKEGNASQVVTEISINKKNIFQALKFKIESIFDKVRN